MERWRCFVASFKFCKEQIATMIVMQVVAMLGDDVEKLSCENTLIVDVYKSREDKMSLEYIIRGDVGDKLNNPVLKFKLDSLSLYDFRELSKYNVTNDVKERYTTMFLLELNKKLDTDEVKEIKSESVDKALNDLI